MVLCCTSKCVCRPCLNEKCPLRYQLLSSFLSLSALSLLVALAMLLGAAKFAGYMVQREARNALDMQVERHISSASAEAAAIIGERFRRLQYGVVDTTAYAYRDAMQEDLELANGMPGYPLSPAHTDLRDTELSAGQEDLTRSVWYYANGTSYLSPVDAEDADEIARSARLDLLWPTAYMNSNGTKSVYVAVELPSSNGSALRHFPGLALSGYSGTLFACDDPDSSVGPCYDPSETPWYQLAKEASVSGDTYLGAASITDPYLDPTDEGNEWLLTMSRAVYSDSSSGASPTLLGVVGADLRLKEIQLSIESATFLESGYSMLVTAAEGRVVAAPSHLWDRNEDNQSTTVCGLGVGICSDDDDWEALLEDANNGFYDFESPDDEEESVLTASPVNATFGEDSEGQAMFYVLSAVPRSEIYEPTEGMSGLIGESTMEILIATGIVAGATLIAVAIAVCLLSGTITRPIVRMTAAADSISRDGAKTDMFGSAAKSWAGRESRSAGTTTWEYLVCRGDDEVKVLGREFALMITGLGKRDLVARAIGLEGTPVYPVNPFTAPQQDRLGLASPAAPSPPKVGISAPRA